ncbi:hypothetical protein DSUL_50272 [Desulfovibrionales bacterium]
MLYLDTHNNRTSSATSRIPVQKDHSELLRPTIIGSIAITDLKSNRECFDVTRPPYSPILKYSHT